MVEMLLVKTKKIVSLARFLILFLVLMNFQ